jgi:hypothetical protein
MTVGVRKLSWSPTSAVGVSISPYNYARKVVDFGGKLREAVIELPPMTVTQAKSMQTFAMKLNGPEGTFYFSDTLGKVPGGNVADSYSGGVVDGGSQTGSALITDGWVPGTTDLFKEGDWISISDRLYSVLEDVDSDGSGNATLTLWPDVQGPVDTTPILVGSAARGTFALKAWPEFVWDINYLMTGYSLAVMEAL